MKKYERPKTALASARLSSPQQIAGGSMDNQIHIIESFAKRKGILLLSGVDIEIASGAKRRPVYEDHIQYIKEHLGAVGYYIIYQIDRFTREGASTYQEMKKELSELNVVLVDAFGIIQESRNMQEMEELGFEEYEWSHQSPSETTEALEAERARSERKTILQRTIPKQIQYTQRGFHVGCPDDGFVNKKIQVGRELRFVMSPDPERAHFFKKMFELRAECRLTDQEIVDLINEMGYLSKIRKKWNKRKTEIIGQSGGVKMTVKQMHKICERFSYAGVLCEKWTHDKPTKAKWSGLVSIETWNKANRGKVHLKEYPDGSLGVLYNYKTERPVFQRLRYNPDYPFKCVVCPECGEPLKGSAPKGRNTHYPQYHCARGHKSFAVSRDQMDETVEEFLAKTEYSEEYIKVIESLLLRRLRQKQADIVQESKTLNERVALLKSEQEKMLRVLMDTESDAVRKMFEAQLEEKQVEIKRAESYRFSVDLSEADVQELITYARKIVESPEKTLIDKDNPLRQEQLFKLFFHSLPTYSELASGTAKKRFLFNRNCISETPPEGGESHQGRLPGIEPELSVPQTDALTVIL
ncbi:MAG: hypothetical protein RL538_659 [Candidatus Parcubacteria bacterium]